MIGNQPDEYDSMTVVDRVRLMIDFYRPAGHPALTPEALATVISQQELKSDIQPDCIAEFLKGRRELALDVRAALCNVIGVPQVYLESEIETEHVRMITVQLQIAIGIRDRGINYLAGRRGNNGSTLAQLRQVLETISLIPIPDSNPQQVRPGNLHAV